MANWRFNGNLLQENVFPRGNGLLSYFTEIEKISFPAESCMLVYLMKE